MSDIFIYILTNILSSWLERQQEGGLPSRCLMRHRWTWGSVNKQQQQSADDQYIYKRGNRSTWKPGECLSDKLFTFTNMTHTNWSGANWPHPPQIWTRPSMTYGRGQNTCSSGTAEGFPKYKCTAQQKSSCVIFITLNSRSHDPL